MTLAGLTGCDPAAAPAAAFTVSATSGNAPLTVVFTDQSTAGNPILLWAWDFGDGTAGNAASPTHTYTDPGVYTVSLTVTSVDGTATETKAGLITVTEDTSLPVTAFTATPISGPTPLDVQFTDQSTSGGAEIRGWLWDFGDGRISQDQNPAHTYTVPGTYSVSLRAFNLHGGTTTLREDLIIAVAPGTPGPCFPDDDTEKPIITLCPETIAIPIDDTCQATVPDITGEILAVDNCGIQEITQQPAIGTILSAATPASITVMDASGNVRICNTLLTLADETPPLAMFVDDNLIVGLEDGCAGELPDLTYAVFGFDRCSEVTISQSPAPGLLITENISITFTIRDESGNETNLTGMTNVLDLQSPQIITCPEPAPLSLDEECSVRVPDLRGGVTATDNCSAVTLAQDPEPGTVITTDTVVVITATDADGLNGYCTVLQTVVDDAPPQITACPDEVTLVLGDNCSVVLPDLTEQLSVADDCGVTSVTQTPIGGTLIDSATRVDFIVSDAAGNESACSTTVVPEDVTPPTISQCPAPRTISLTDNCQATVPNLTNEIVAGDNCTTASITQSPAAGTRVDGPATVTITVTDTAGNTSACTVDLAVEDTEPPAFAPCPGVVNVPADATCRGVLPDFTITNAARDNCGIASFTQVPAPGLVITTTTDVTLTLTDTSGNVNTCVATVFIDDNIPPEITSCPADFTLETDDGCDAVLPDLSGEVVATDNCGTITVTQSPEADTVITTETLVTLTIRDDAGNTDTCEVTVSLADAEAPVITNCPPDATLALGDGCQAILPNYTGIVSATDNCAVTAITQTPAAGTPLTAATTVTITATDAAGNEDACTLLVSVLDTTPPVITSCTGSIALAVSGSCEATVPDLSGEVTATDNCGIASITQSLPADSVITEDTAVTVTVTDDAGNNVECVINLVLDSCSAEGETSVDTVLYLTREVVGEGNYTPGAPIDIRMQIAKIGNESVSNIELEETIPAGWTFAGVVSGVQADVSPAVETADTLVFTWDETPSFPFEFVYQLNVPSNATEIEPISGMVFYDVGQLKGRLVSNLEEVLVPFDQTVIAYSRTLPGAQVYRPGVPLIIEVYIKIVGIGVITSLTATETLPPGFSFQGIVSPATGYMGPPNGSTGAIELVGDGPRIFEGPIIYRVIPDGTASGISQIDGVANYTVDGPEVPTNRKQTNIPRGVAGSFTISDADPAFARYDGAGLVTLLGDFDLAYDPASLSVQFSELPGVVRPATDFVGEVSVESVSDTSIDIITPNVDLPFNSSVYLTAVSGEATVVSNTFPFQFFGCADDGLPQMSASVDQVLIRRRILGGQRYTPGVPLVVEIELDVVGPNFVTALAVSESVPAGFFLSDQPLQGCAPQLGVPPGTFGIMDFAWFSIPTLPARFTYTLEVPVSATGVKRMTGEGVIRTFGKEIESNLTATLLAGEETIVALNRPEILVVPEAQPVVVSLQFTKLGDADIESLEITEGLPAGWTFGGIASGTVPGSMPALGTAGPIVFDWTEIPAFPFTLRYFADPPESQESVSVISGTYDFNAVDEQPVIDVDSETLIVVE